MAKIRDDLRESERLIKEYINAVMAEFASKHSEHFGVVSIWCERVDGEATRVLDVRIVSVARPARKPQEDRAEIKEGLRACEQLIKEYVNTVMAEFANKHDVHIIQVLVGVRTVAGSSKDASVSDVKLGLDL